MQQLESPEVPLRTVQRYVAAIEEVVGSGDNLGIIAVLELLTFVVLASAQSATWRNEMILYVTDNAM